MLDIAEVQQALANASQSLEQTVDQTELMLDQAFFNGTGHPIRQPLPEQKSNLGCQIDGSGAIVSHVSV